MWVSRQTSFDLARRRTVSDVLQQIDGAVPNLPQKCTICRKYLKRIAPGMKIALIKSKNLLRRSDIKVMLIADRNLMNIKKDK